MQAELSISFTRYNGSTTVRLSGELDLATANQLRAALHDVRGPVRFDLERLSFIDAGGVGALVETARTNGTTTILNPTPPIRRVLNLCQIDQWLTEDTAHDDRERQASLDRRSARFVHP